MMKSRLLLSLLALATTVAVPGPSMAAKLTDADVGDADSFGKKVVWIGLVQTGAVLLDASCNPDDIGQLGPNDRCVILNPAPALTTFEFPDLGHITLPGKSTETLICHWVTPLIGYTMVNSTANPASGSITLLARFRLESTVLSGPPFNGGIDIGSLSSYRDTLPLAPSEVRSQTIQPTRTCIEGMISASTLMNTHGLTENQVKDFFKNPITIRAGVSGSARLVTGGQVIIGTRFTGDAK